MKHDNARSQPTTSEFIMKSWHALFLVAGLSGWLTSLSAAEPPPDHLPPAAPEAKPAGQADNTGAKQNGAPAGSETEKGLRLNFRGVPLEMVLNYLSDAAGFIIVLETKVEGKVDVWSNQPMSKDEAVNRS